MEERQFLDDEAPEGADFPLRAEVESEGTMPPVEPTPVVPIALHAAAAAESGIAGYPTEDPKDLNTVWCPTPNTIGSHSQGFRKIK